MLDLDMIRIDGGTQIRAELNQETVDSYAEAYLAGAVFPAVTVFFDGKDRWLADGFHRYFAAKKAGKKSILEKITPGTKRDAILFSLGANGTHGLNRTNADKRNAITTMLEDPEWAVWSDNAIAKACHVSAMTVGRYRSELSPIYNKVIDAPVTRTVERNGKTYEQNTANIGKLAASLPKLEPLVEPEAEISPDYTELDAALDNNGSLLADNDNLRTALALANMGDIPDEDRNQAATLIAELRAENQTLTAHLNAVTLSRDSLMEETTQMKRQMAMQRKEIDKLKHNK